MIILSNTGKLQSVKAQDNRVEALPTRVNFPIETYSKPGKFRNPERQYTLCRDGREILPSFTFSELGTKMNR